MIYLNVNRFFVLLHIQILHTLMHNLKISPLKATLPSTSTFTTPEICQLFIGQEVSRVSFETTNSKAGNMMGVCAPGEHNIAGLLTYGTIGSIYTVRVLFHLHEAKAPASVFVMVHSESLKHSKSVR